MEGTLNEQSEAEAEKLTQAARYERNEQRQGHRSGHCSRNLTVASGDVILKVSELMGASFETAIIERYRRRESSVEEAPIACVWQVHPSGVWRTSLRPSEAAKPPPLPEAS